MDGVYAAIAAAFTEMAPAAVFIALCERAIGMLVDAVRGRGRLM